MPKKRSVIAMSANYLLLKENKQEMNTSMNQTILKEDTNTSSSRSMFETMELSFTVFIMLTLIFGWKPTKGLFSLYVLKAA